ncbi:recombinase family protein [Limimaricola cinnabarinus]|uniref:DNA invertase n=1 Tax=Limimaricola cinnabarinus TaxID=1125964 RepID=A0A2G1MBY3_9RHOB|nr:recombinase family protein [Limimaricola cinnabarinus]PHP26241.1 DNA invertase [Limimaricola cinnabarinus]
MSGQLVGYARVSTVAQDAGLEGQLKTLEGAGCTRVFEERVSSVDLPAREKLAEALRYLREGDTLVVTKLDRLARSTGHLHDLLGELEAKGVSLKVLDMGVDTSTPTGKLIFNLVGSIAQFEREIMLERQREGIAKARAAGKYKGRKPTARAKTGQVRQLQSEGMGATQIARKLGISRASVYRILADLKIDSQEIEGSW